MTLAGKTLFISGGSRGIALAIAVRAARGGASIALIAKTAEPHNKARKALHAARRPRGSQNFIISDTMAVIAEGFRYDRSGIGPTRARAARVGPCA